MTEEIRRASASDAGCWIDGHWGQYGIARLVEIAECLGYQVTGDADRVTLERYADAMRWAHASADERTEADYVAMEWLADDAERWLNDNVAPEGFHFEWSDGEFFLWADAEDLFEVIAEGLFDVDPLPCAEAVALLNETLDEWEADGWTVERGWASSGNYAAARATKGSAERFAAIERYEA